MGQQALNGVEVTPIGACGISFLRNRYLGATLVSKVEWGTMPAYRHNKSAAFSFADGHVDTHRWQDKETFQKITRTGPSSPTVLNSKDIPWLSSHATAWK